MASRKTDFLCTLTTVTRYKMLIVLKQINQNGYPTTKIKFGCTHNISRLNTWTACRVKEKYVLKKMDYKSYLRQIFQDFKLTLERPQKQTIKIINLYIYRYMYTTKNTSLNSQLVTINSILSQNFVLLAMATKMVTGCACTVMYSVCSGNLA